MLSSKNFCFTSKVEMIACFWIIIIAIMANFAASENNFYTHGRYGKREESNAPAVTSPFFSGSRYGRGGERSDVTGTSKTIGKTAVISPRVDRFFLGSRYGKRTLPLRNFDSNNRLTSLRNLEVVLSYFDRIRRINKNQEPNQIYYDNGNGYDNGKNNNEGKCDGDSSAGSYRKSDSNGC